MSNPFPQADTHYNHYDVTGCVNVTQVSDVCSAVCDIYTKHYDNDAGNLGRIRQSYQDFEKLFTGQYPGYHSCDTLYHDMQHTLDMSLAMARLTCAFDAENLQSPMGAERFVFGIAVSLFHDAGYIRQVDHDDAINGAAYTLSHVTRSGRFLKEYLPNIGFENHSQLASTLVHFTGYEIPVEDIVTPTDQDRKLGYLLGTADLLAQLSDRCYLEKCRDRLYPEFVLGGLARPGSEKSTTDVYTSPENLLERTPTFFETSVLVRLEENFEQTHRLEAIFFEGNTPYMNAINKNIAYLEKLIEKGSFEDLRREPPQTAGSEHFPFKKVTS